MQKNTANSGKKKIKTTQSSTEQTYPENKNVKKNNCMDISSDKQVKYFMRQRLGHG